MSYLRLAILLSMILLAGCLEAKKKPVDYGPESSVQDVSKALSTPLKDYSPFTMQKGDRVSWDFYYFIKNTGEHRIPMNSFTNEVINRTENAKTETIDFRIQLSVTDFDKDGNPSPPVIGQSDYTVVKPIVSPESLLSLLNVNLFSGEQLTAANRVSFHRLKVEEILKSLPDTMKDKSVCTKWENCKIPVTKVHYETVEYKKEGPERTEWDYLLTPHLPFVSMLHSDKEQIPANIETCLTKQLSQDGRKFIVTFCSSLTDFAFGKSE